MMIQIYEYANMIWRIPKHTTRKSKKHPPVILSHQTTKSTLHTSEHTIPYIQPHTRIHIHTHEKEKKKKKIIHPTIHNHRLYINNRKPTTTTIITVIKTENSKNGKKRSRQTEKKVKSKKRERKQRIENREVKKNSNREKEMKNSPLIYCYIRLINKSRA